MLPAPLFFIALVGLTVVLALVAPPRHTFGSTGPWPWVILGIVGILMVLLAGKIGGEVSPEEGERRAQRKQLPPGLDVVILLLLAGGILYNLVPGH